MFIFLSILNVNSLHSSNSLQTNSITQLQLYFAMPFTSHSMYAREYKRTVSALEENVYREQCGERESRKGEYPGEEERYWMPDKVVITHSWNAIVRFLPLVMLPKARTQYYLPRLYSMTISFARSFFVRLARSFALWGVRKGKSVLLHFIRDLHCRRLDATGEKGRRRVTGYDTGAHLYYKAYAKLIHFFARRILFPWP